MNKHLKNMLISFMLGMGSFACFSYFLFNDDYKPKPVFVQGSEIYIRAKEEKKYLDNRLLELKDVKEYFKDSLKEENASKENSFFLGEILYTDSLIQVLENTSDSLDERIVELKTQKPVKEYIAAKETQKSSNSNSILYSALLILGGYICAGVYVFNFAKYHFGSRTEDD